jgi:hypothetical protein
MGAPLEAMLRDGEPDLPFALHWANEPWVGSWHGGRKRGVGSKGVKQEKQVRGEGQKWGGKSQGGGEGGEANKDVLLSQSYEPETWTPHFQYLLPFFKHKNCIKIDGEPLFLIYRLHQLGEGENMLLNGTV